MKKTWENLGKKVFSEPVRQGLFLLGWNPARRLALLTIFFLLSFVFYNVPFIAQALIELAQKFIFFYSFADSGLLGLLCGIALGLVLAPLAGFNMLGFAFSYVLLLSGIGSIALCFGALIAEVFLESALAFKKGRDFKKRSLISMSVMILCGFCFWTLWGLVELVLPGSYSIELRNHQLMLLSFVVLGLDCFLTLCYFHFDYALRQT